MYDANNEDDLEITEEGCISFGSKFLPISSSKHAKKYKPEDICDVIRYAYNLGQQNLRQQFKDLFNIIYSEENY